MSFGYKRIKKLAKGEFGTVFLTQRESDGALMVDKEVGVDTSDEAAVDEIQREITVLQRLRYPLMTEYVTSFVDMEGMHIIMEYCDGGTLRQRIESLRQAGTRFDEDTIMRYFVQLCVALQYMHQNQILHRDLKSENVFLLSDGNLKLGDFGMARLLSTRSEFAHTVTGTPYYMSPELCNEEPYNHKSDVWGLGCLLYEMVALRRPFVARNLRELVQVINSVQFPNPENMCGPDLCFLINAMLIKNPDDRPEITDILAMPCCQPELTRLRALFPNLQV